MKSNLPASVPIRIGMVFAALFAAFSVHSQVFEAGVQEIDAPFSAPDAEGRNVYLIEFAEPGLLELH